MNVLLTGGSGFVGRAVLTQLRAAGHGVRFLIRRPDTAAARALAERFGVELFRGDVLGDDLLAPACAGMDAVVHLVGIIAEYGAQTFENIHARATRHLVEAARSAGVSRFVHMSALGTRPGAASRYHQTKWSAEQAVRRSDLEWTIFRPSIIYGPGDGFVGMFERMTRWSPVLPLMGDGSMRLQPVPVTDVAISFARALTDRDAVGRTYDLCGPIPLTLREILQAVLRVTGRRRLLLPLPLGAMRVQAALLEMICPALFRRPPPLSRDQLLMLLEDNVGDPEPASVQFGLAPVAFEVGLAAYLKTRAAPG